VEALLFSGSPRMNHSLQSMCKLVRIIDECSREVSGKGQAKLRRRWLLLAELLTAVCKDRYNRGALGSYLSGLMLLD
jgi:hypothetical protein